MIYVIFTLLYVLTFFPAWYFLLKLIAIASSKGNLLSINFILTFVFYQFLIALPYLYLVLFASEQTPAFVELIAVSSVIVGFIITIVRLFFADQVNKILWNVYGNVYDGLLQFYPYVTLQNKVAEVTQVEKDMHVLDLGCGSGNQSMLLYENCHKITAVDNATSMLKQFKKKIKKNSIQNIDIHQSDSLEFMKNNQETFDRIVLVNVLYTVEKRKELIVELLRSLKPNGVLVITNSDTGGNNSLIQEHARERGYLSLLRPKLIAIFIIDSLISELAKTGHFSFVPEEQIKAEFEQQNATYSFVSRCYGDMNILFTVTKNNH